MPRNPSPKQRFIKEYARLIYGPAAKSNALTKKDRAAIKHLFFACRKYEDALVKYPGWITDNWIPITRRLNRGNFRADKSKPGLYLISSDFVSRYLPYVIKNENLSRF
jgi:hypothetical protein